MPLRNSAVIFFTMPKRLPEICFRRSFPLYLAAMVLFLPGSWLISAWFAALFHEICHLAALIFLRHPVRRIILSASGAEIATEPMRPSHELICALAGPLGGMSLLLFVKQWPMVAVCAWIHSLYNLLPIYPSDGGRALRCGLTLVGFREELADWMEIITLSMLLAICVWASLRFTFGPIPLVCGILMAIPAVRKK